MPKLNMVKALNLALFQAMEHDADVLVLGEDVGVDGGVFRVTDDLQRKFGSQRVIDSPLAEAAIIGTAVGMALYGLKPVCEIQFSGFAFQCFHQIENHCARYRARSQGRFHIPMVIRMPYGGSVRALEHHSESEEQFYAHISGLKMVIPSGPRNARALLAAVLRDEDGVDAEVIDLLTISPLDRDALVTSVKKTGRAVVVHEAPRSFGPGAEIAASIMDGAFLSLEAPVRRVAAHDVPFVGFAREKANIPDVPRVVAAARATLAF